MRPSFGRGLGLMLTICVTTSAARAAILVPQNEAARFGLTRAWATQAGSQRVVSNIAHVNLHEGMLLVLTTGSQLSALDAETGRALWKTQVGPSNHQSTEPTGNDRQVVVVNGSVLYVLDKHTGNIMWQRKLGGPPGAGPGVSQTHAFVPMVSGLMEGYNLEKGAKQTPWVYKSFGRVLIPPMTTGQTVSWATEKGYFYVADPSGKGIRYRLETRDAIHARPSYWTPNLYACSTDGYVYAVDEAQGKIIWRFAIGDAIYRAPVAIDGKVYVVSGTTGLYCLDGASGLRQWHTERIVQFVSVSPTRVYAVDSLRRLAILDAKTGRRLGALPLDDINIHVLNNQSDRIFLANSAGVVQCLRETDLRNPVAYVPPPVKPPVADAREKKPVGKPTDKSAPPKDDAGLDEPAEEADAPAMEDEKPAKSEDSDGLFDNP
jgi:outer membrane protein assembly factor BamB